MPSKSDTKELVLIFICTISLLKIATLLQFIPLWRQNIFLISTAIQILIPLVYLTKKNIPLSFVESDISSLWKSFLTFLITSLIIFPIFFFGAHLYETLLFGKKYFTVPFRNVFLFSFTQILFVAMPEEFLFRGWFQTSLNQYFPKRWNFLGTSVGLALPVTALIFAFTHSIISLQWWHFAIFFPALVFGWLREKTGGLLAPILFHATSNILAQLISIRYL